MEKTVELLMKMPLFSMLNWWPAHLNRKAYLIL